MKRFARSHSRMANPYHVFTCTILIWGKIIIQKKCDCIRRKTLSYTVNIKLDNGGRPWKHTFKWSWSSKLPIWAAFLPLKAVLIITEFSELSVHVLLRQNINEAGGDPTHKGLTMAQWTNSGQNLTQWSINGRNMSQWSNNGRSKEQRSNRARNVSQWACIGENMTQCSFLVKNPNAACSVFLLSMRSTDLLKPTFRQPVQYSLNLFSTFWTTLGSRTLLSSRN